MKYTVTYRIDARWMCEVEAGSIEEAVEIAQEEFMDANFGQITDIVDAYANIVEDEEGDILWDRK